MKIYLKKKLFRGERGLFLTDLKYLPIEWGINFDVMITQNPEEFSNIINIVPGTLIN